jgi:hypothetical protein
MKWGPLYSHLLMEESLPLLRILFWLDCCSYNSSSKFYINDLSPFIILCIIVQVEVQLFVFELDHQ